MPAATASPASSSPARASAWLLNWAARARSARARRAAAARAELAEGSGATRVPTGATLPSMANPQFSSCSPEVISCSGVQCSTVTMSVVPPRRAIPM